MNQTEFLRRCPRLSHVAPGGAWETIKQHGLRTAEQLIHAADLDDTERKRLLEGVRTDQSLFIANGVPVRLRDQEPLAKSNLPALLGDGLTVTDWIALLNKRIYLFVDEGAREKLLSKYVGLDGSQDLLVFSPLRLWNTARHNMELSAQNTGAVARKSMAYKFRDTFLPVSRFPDKKPAEVTILDGLDDLTAVVEVTRIHSTGERERLPL